MPNWRYSHRKFQMFPLTTSKPGLTPESGSENPAVPAPISPPLLDGGALSRSERSVACSQGTAYPVAFLKPLLFPLQIFKAFGLDNQSICLFTPPPGTLELIFLFPECWNRKRSGAGELRKALRSLYFFHASLTVPWRPLSETKDSGADFSKSKSPQSIQKNK